MPRLVATLALLIPTMAPSFAYSTSVPCSVIELRNNPEGYFWPLADIERFVDEADVIVRAVAAAADPTSRGGWPTSVRFEVRERLRGTELSPEMVFPGVVVEDDDFNPGDVPYRIVRHSGQRGDCYARDYRIGAEYLFLLRHGRDGLSPHWAALAPTNEQITGSEDPWVEWVRERLEGLDSVTRP